MLPSGIAGQLCAPPLLTEDLPCRELNNIEAWMPGAVFDVTQFCTMCPSWTWTAAPPPAPLAYLLAALPPAPACSLAPPAKHQ